MKGLFWRGLAVLAVCACVPKGAKAPSAPERGQPIRFVLPTFPSQRPHDLASDRGQVVLLDVWATWCDPCRVSLPAYQRLASAYANQGLRVYALNVDEDPAQVSRFVEETKLELPILLDPDAAVAEPILKVKLMPTTFLLDRQGAIRFVHEGWAGELLATYRAEIDQLLAEKGAP